MSNNRAKILNLKNDKQPSLFFHFSSAQRNGRNWPIPKKSDKSLIISKNDFFSERDFPKVDQKVAV